MDTFLVIYKAHPDKDSPHHGKIAVAICTFWVRSEKAEYAKQHAIRFGAQMGWVFHRLQSIAPTTREDCRGDTIRIERFEFAQEKGISFILDTYERDSPALN